jgi:serine protease Do
MSNFIYYDNFDGDGNKEPINFDFDDKPKGNGSRSVAVVCFLSVLFALIFGFFGGYAFYRFALTSGDPLISPVEVNINQSSNTQQVPLQATTGNSVTSVVAQVKDTVVVIKTTSGEGSGVVVGKFTGSYRNGYYIITNAHVIDGAYNKKGQNLGMQIIHNSGATYKQSSVDVVGVSVANDIAILRIYDDTRELKCATFASNDYTLSVGEDVFAIGNSLGKFDGTVTKGSISYDQYRNVEIDGNEMNLIQLDISVYPGNSGGGLFNLRGELVGIVNAKIVDNDVGRIGFAIPHARVLDIYLNCIKLSGN